MALGKGLDSLIPNARKTMGESAAAAKTDRVWQIPLTEIIPNPEQPRRVFDHQDLEDLVASIKKHGIMQPITVTERMDGGYELIAGERRFRASQIAGLATIPAIVRIASEQEKLELALIENIQRQNLNAIEEAFAFKRLIDEFNLTQQEVADQVGKSRPVVANTIRLLELPEEIQRALMDGRLSAGKARALLSLKSVKEQLEVFNGMLNEGSTVRDVEAAVAAKGPESRKGSVRRDPNVASLENQITDALGAKATIRLRGDHGTIELQFTSREELRRIVEEISE
ncbi:MAG: ParB/RepB/Spo0J family partition protein [Candidatus Magasanikbacteria bacterium]|nr:ParB/RepB/Spo0J family partition protein [Candidatus Magasanikbacteria bacterium]